MKCGARLLHGSFKNGGSDFRATFENFEATQYWSTMHDIGSIFGVIPSWFDQSQVASSQPPGLM